MSVRQRIACAHSKALLLARANAKFDKIVHASQNGATLQEAAQIVGLTVGGVQGILYRRGLTKRWPIDPAKLA